MTSQPPPRVTADVCPQCGGPLPAGEGQTVICGFCGSRLIRAGQPAEGKSGAPVRRGMHLTPITCADQQGVGMEAFRLLIPAGWEFQGGVTWVADNPGTPVRISFQVRNPAGPEGFDLFPVMPFYWTNNPMVHLMYPAGARYFGNEVLPPSPAAQVLQQISLPRLRGGAPGLQVLAVEPIPDLVGQVQAARPVPTQATSADAARARLRYQMGNQQVEEELNAVVEVYRVAMPALMGFVEHIWWQVNHLAWRAAAGQLDRPADLFQAILRSVRINPEWFGRCVQIANYLIQNQIQHIHNIGQLSRSISQMSDQMREENLAQYYQRQAVYDRLSDQFSQVTRGVQAYQDPHQDHPVELPNTFNYAWSNPLGEYIMSDDPNFNPNVGSNLNWEPLQPA